MTPDLPTLEPEAESRPPGGAQPAGHADAAGPVGREAQAPGGPGALGACGGEVAWGNPGGELTRARDHGGAYLTYHRPASASIGDRECCAPASSREALMSHSQLVASVVPFAAIGRPACPRCKAAMMLVSIEPTRAQDVDLHSFRCAVCNQTLESFAAFEDPMRSKGLGRWLQGDLHPPK
jgi:hypothetical protein